MLIHNPGSKKSTYTRPGLVLLPWRHMAMWRWSNAISEVSQPSAKAVSGN